MKKTIEYNFNGNFEIIYNCTIDMREFGKFHPYMKEVKIIQQTNDFIEYNIKESVLLFGFIPQWPEYNAKVFEVEKNKRIQYVSMVKPTMPLIINFTFSVSKGITKLVEEINLTGNKVLCSILFGIMKKAHLQLFERMEIHALK